MKRFYGFLLIFLMSVSAVLAAQTDVQDVRIGRNGSMTRFVMDISGAVPYRAFVLNNPPRVVIDLPVMPWSAPMNKGDASRVVKSYRHGTYQGDTMRVVLDLARPAIISSHTRLPPDQGRPWRYVFDLKPVDPITFQQAVNRVVTGGGAPKTATKNTDPATTTIIVDEITTTTGKKTTLIAPSVVKKPLIVIDAGHGGVDPGALATNGMREKVITLAVARKVRDKLQASGRYRVRMTRDNDTYIKLPERVAIARRASSDLFVSLHADTIGRPNVQGASVYTLSQVASDAESAKLAARENAVDSLVNVDVGENVDADVQDILIDLVTRDTMNQSKILADTTVRTFRALGVTTLPQRPHRSAGFAVLKSPDIPSILIEMGYLSNRSEAVKLSSDAHREKIANAVVETIDRFFNETRKE
jgi:N-acetylmuramoyl-L-alanine amidase